MQNTPDADPLEVARTMSNLATCYTAQKRYESAEPLFSKALAIGRGDEAAAMSTRASAIRAKEK